jgi:phage replication initiation protein
LKIDWLEGTILNEDIESTLMELQRLFPDWQELPHGGLRYASSAAVLEKGRVYWSRPRVEMGVHVSLPPTAIELSQSDFISFARELKSLGMKFTRVDLAADDTRGILNMEIICQAVESGHYISTSKKKPTQIIDYEGGGRTFYFGSPKSKTRIRLYDKAAEQRAARKRYVGHWIRTEMQLRDERADAAVKYILEQPTTWRTHALGWLLSVLDFKTPSEDSNKSRWATAAWWLDFLEDVAKQRIFISRRIRTLDDLTGWVEHQAGPSLKVIQAVHGKDALNEMADRSASRLKKKHHDLIRQARVKPAKPKNAGRSRTTTEEVKGNGT